LILAINLNGRPTLETEAFYFYVFILSPGVISPWCGSPYLFSYDQNRKAILYATHGIPEYWVFDIPGSRVHVFCEPPNGQYQTQESFHGSQKITPLNAMEKELPFTIIVSSEA
jgi:hypothetical protein